MCFVHQYAHAPFLRLREGVEHRVRVEVIVIVTDHDVAPARQFLAQVIRTDRVLKGDLAQCAAVEPQNFERRASSGGQAVVEAACERARFTVASLVGMFASFLSRDQFEYAQRLIAAQGGECIESELTARVLGGQEKDLVELRGRPCFK
jgi:hypothetical protein